MADPRTFARTRMFGWRNYQHPSYFGVDSAPVIVVSPVVINPVPVSTSYLLDAVGGNILTDASGNRLTYP